jgi:hypothetical protein
VKPQIAGVIFKKKNCHFLSAVIPYTTDARAEAAARNPQLRLMFRLVHFHLLRDGDDNGGAYALFPVTFWPPPPASSTASVTHAPRKPRFASRRILRCPLVVFSPSIALAYFAFFARFI